MMLFSEWIGKVGIGHADGSRLLVVAAQDNEMATGTALYIIRFTILGNLTFGEVQVG